MGKTYGFGIVGAGMIGGYHADAIKQLPNARLVAVCDREADLYDLFITERPAGVDWLVRAAWDRMAERKVPVCPEMMPGAGARLRGSR